ncbi:putative SnoaL-like aldol condensation-catalyzing enzyme [Clavibacter michiganensis]|uniref:nuclear transport factor 2 family protein n=1 Tax=Clavibacter michiganensis TaxID=28447 RepID=UPI001959EE4D|nr:nuclear transport factor 2 family protein [Clavibacter michiganensis]MBM7412291.1 putative SnoaL-like aldol condensation-catalyzing enzyme [Clavibacter michiganensis]
MSVQRIPVSLLARGTAALAGVVILAGCSAPGAASAATDAAPDATTAVATTGPTASGDGGTTADRTDSDAEDRNADTISALFTAAFPDPSSAAANAAAIATIAPDATANGTGAKAGPGGFLDEFASAHQRVPGAQAVVKHIAADGDLVAVHYQITSKPDDERTGEAAVDLFRLADGKVTAVWSFHQPVPQGTPASGNTNTMFSDLYQGEADAPELTEQQEEANRQLAVGAYDTLFRDHDASVLDRSFDPAYLQHNTVAANGTAALKAFFSGGAQFPAQQSVISIADDDLVWTFSQPVGAKADDPFLAADIFRVDGGLIREHWDVVPAS